ncbi:MAG: GtrA family protein, partial [Marmoricola sp.]|nr:GtrA family protein [Marmoricola sp.]
MTNTSPRPDSRSPSRPVRKVATYLGGSAVAAVSSEVALLLLYGVLGASTSVASVVAWLAGAIPNYWLNRSWTWQQRGRPSLRREVLPYVTIILVTLLLATLTTEGADAWLRGTDVSQDVRVVLVAAVFLGVYVVMFFLRFFLLDRLFTRV